MNIYLKIGLVVLIVLFAAGLLVAGGFMLGRHFFTRNAFMPSPLNPWGTRMPFFGRFSNNMHPGGMRGWLTSLDEQSRRNFNLRPAPMHGRFNFSGSVAEPLTMQEAHTLFKEYIQNIENDDLYLHEIMLFENNAYAIVAERSTGIGAMELLADYATQSVSLEFGPSRMWNQKYGMMRSSRSGFGCGAALWLPPSENGDFSMTISQVQARGIAKDYLDDNFPGTTASEGMPFYGYYSFDYESDGKIVGMLSVNGYSGAVWPHHWHAAFLEEWEAD